MSCLLPQCCPLKSVELRLGCCRQRHLDLGPDRFAMQHGSAASYWFYKMGVYDHVGAPPSVIWLWATWQKFPSSRPHTQTHTRLRGGAELAHPPCLSSTCLTWLRSDPGGGSDWCRAASRSSTDSITRHSVGLLHGTSSHPEQPLCL